MKIIPLITLLFIHCASSGFLKAQHDASRDINHLVPVNANIHIDESLLEYDVKLKRTLLANLPKFPLAFALMKPSMGGSESCVFLIQNKSGKYVIEARKAERHIWYDKSEEKNKISIHSKEVDAKKAAEIMALWKEVLLDVRYPKPDPDRHAWTDVSSVYYAAFIKDLRIVAGETPNPQKEGGKLDEMSKMTYWMLHHCMKDTVSLREKARLEFILREYEKKVEPKK